MDDKEFSLVLVLVDDMDARPTIEGESALVAAELPALMQLMADLDDAE